MCSCLYEGWEAIVVKTILKGNVIVITVMTIETLFVNDIDKLAVKL